MTGSQVQEILAAGREALEYEPGRLDELTVDQIVDVVGRAVLHAAAEKIRSYADPADEWAANLIDPDKQETT